MAEKITVENGHMNVPDHAIIPFIEGDGIGPDIWAAASKVIEAAVQKAYGDTKSIEWKESSVKTQRISMLVSNGKKVLLK